MDKFLQNIGALAGGAAHTVATGSTLAALIGAVYIIDCRITAGNDYEKATNCYFVGLPIMGIGVAGRSGFKIGYETYNPTLKRPEEEQTKVTSNTRPRSQRATRK